MASMSIETNRVHEGCSYYLMCRIDGGVWFSFLNKGFVLHSNNGKLHGQFLSSSWFKKKIKRNDTIDVIVVRLPNRESTLHPDIAITDDILSQRLTDYERDNRVSEYVNYNMLDFVVIYKHYSSDTTKYICNILQERNSENTRSSITDNSIFDETQYDNINITFDMINDINPLPANDAANDAAIPIPHLSRNDGSWNAYRNSFSDTDNEPSYYITCPQFTINI